MAKDSGPSPIPPVKVVQNVVSGSSLGPKTK
jgi:hypothetical protein